MMYVVSAFETWYWQPILATKDAAEALELAREIGFKGRLEEKPEPETPWAPAAARPFPATPANDH